MSCLDIVSGCPDCLAEAERREAHICDGLCEVYRDMKRDDPEFHRRLHAPVLCRHCGSILDDRKGLSRTRVRTCANGLCHVWYCPDCGGERGRDGLVVCPANCAPLEGEIAT